MSFVDHVRILVSAGDGGDGQMSFLRSKLEAKGGPNGGDGGRGGSVVLVAEPGLGSLSAYVRNRLHRVKNAGGGGPHNRFGADSDDLLLAVPVGTLVRDAQTDELLADLAKPGSRYVAAVGGRGGRGNASLKSNADRVPNYAERGEPGEERELVLELHLVADVGLLGPPNAGKSTLLGAISRANPKIADYPFTTIEPGLGVVSVPGPARTTDSTSDDERITVADLPGLIEGASKGKGLGLRFLRHADRCGVLAFVVDLAGTDPVGDLEAVAGEVEAYEPELARRIGVVVGNKTDLAGADLSGAEAWAEQRGARFVAISAAQEANLEELRTILGEEVVRSRAELGEPESFVVYRPAVEDRVVVAREDNAFRVRSERVERMVAQTPLDNSRAVRRLQRKLRALGVESALKREGANEGDEVRIGNTAFEWIPDDA
jgi:GTP-binding protein